MVDFEAFWLGMGENMFSSWKASLNKLLVRLLALFVISTNYHYH